MRKDPKYSMGIVGNCSYIAYIDTNAGVRWMCMPRFDSSFVFGSLLDKEKGGEFSVRPAGKGYTSTQRYMPNTNILITEFKTNDGRFRVIDCAPRFRQNDRYFKPLMLFRKIELLEGSPVITVKCRPVGEYGYTESEAVMGSNHIRYLNLADMVRLTANVPLNYIIEEKPFVLNEDSYLAFTYGLPLEAPLAETADIFIKKTAEYWRSWIKSTSIPGIFQEEVIRSALVLKLHQYEDTGAVIAAGTTSLPEHEGSGRNWDYRYCWMRDTYYTLNAFNNIGHFEELERYFEFIRNVMMNENEYISPLYTVLGERVPSEKYLNLYGFHGNTPVRIGNNANGQIQNDVYGQILVSLLPLFVDRRLSLPRGASPEPVVSWLLARIEKTMDSYDSGLWEFGVTKQQHLYTYLFHWAGCMAGIRIGNMLTDSTISEKSAALAQKARDYIEKCYDEKRGVYTQAVGSAHLDASSLQLVTMNYLDPSSDRAIAHINAHEEELFSERGLYFRYKSDDIGKQETSFIICGFWFAEALAAAGKLEKSHGVISELLSCSNHLGLFSEDGDSSCGQWGNFPQTYSHVGLVNAVYRLAKKLDMPIFF